MTLKTRKFLYLFFVFLFIVITPIISMYAAGYKFSGGFKVQKTGSLIINSNPRGARILINNKVQQNIFKKIFSSGGGYITTPAKIKNLSPEEYTVEINLKDYLPWKKKLTINPGQSTFAEDINLLKDYIAKNETIFFIENQKDNSLLKIYNIDEAREVNQISLPLSDYSFINYGHKLINLYDPKHKILYLIDPYDNFKPLRETINNITKTYWADDTRLLYTNDFEVWIFNLKNLQKKLLTRISQKIDNIIWHPSNNNIIYSTNKNINVIELDDREKYNITKIIELDGITNTVLNKKGDTLYFYAQIGNQKGLYKLLIQ